MDNNPNEYASYFKWKQYVTFRPKEASSAINIYCDMCIRLQMENFFGIQKQVINDLGDFWNAKKDCKIRSTETNLLRTETYFNLVDIK